MVNKNKNHAAGWGLRARADDGLACGSCRMGNEDEDEDEDDYDSLVYAAVRRLTRGATAWNRRGKAPSRGTLPAQSMTIRASLEHGRDNARGDLGVRGEAERHAALRGCVGRPDAVGGSIMGPGGRMPALHGRRDARRYDEGAGLRRPQWGWPGAGGKARKTA